MRDKLGDKYFDEIDKAIEEGIKKCNALIDVIAIEEEEGSEGKFIIFFTYCILK